MLEVLRGMGRQSVGRDDQRRLEEQVGVHDPGPDRSMWAGAYSE